MFSRSVTRRVAAMAVRRPLLLPSTTVTLYASRRSFWNPFASFSSTPAAAQDPIAARNAAKHASIVDEAHKDANLHNEQLLGACLELLDMCGGTAAGGPASDLLDNVSRNCIWELVDVLLHDFRRSPSEQFDLVYIALCLPVSQEQRQVQRCLMVLLNSVLPQSLYNVFTNVNLIVDKDDAQSMEQRDALLRLVHALLGDLQTPPDLEEEEVLLVYLDDVKTLFPALKNCSAWAAVEGDAVSIALKAKLYALLGRLCAELDEEKCGKVRLADLQGTAERVLGKEQAAKLLNGAQADKDGKIAYPQLAALLTRPPPRAKKQNE